MSSGRTLVQRAFRLNSTGLGGRVVRGAAYQFLGMAVRTGTTIGSLAILARLLEPADFGYVAMAAVITDFAALFASFGFANVLIQRTVLVRIHLDTIFWASAALGAVLSVAILVASFFAGLLYEEPLVGSLLRILGVTFFIGGLSTVPWAILSRLMFFRAQFWVQSLSKIGGAVFAVLLAWQDAGVWSLVWGGVVGQVLNVAISFAMVPYKPRWRFSGRYLRSIAATSGSYFGGGLIYYLQMNLDLLLVGRYLGAAPLGLYQNARSLTDEIRARIAIPLQHVLFPAFSSLQADPERFRSAVLRSARLLAAAVIPIGFGVSATAPELVRTLYGDQWLEMIPVMTMFGLTAACRASTAIAAPLFNAKDRVALGLRYGMVGTVLSFVALLLTVSRGIDVVAAGLALTSLYSLVVMHAAFRLIGMTLADLSRVLVVPVGSALVMWWAIAESRGFLLSLSAGSPLLPFFLEVALGSVVYSVCLAMVSQAYLGEVRSLLRGLRVG